MPLLPLIAAVALTAADPGAPADLPASSGAGSPVSLSAPAVEGAPDAAPSLAPAAPRLKLLGLQLDGGFPDGGVVSLVVRPLKWVRADAGLAYNYLSFGARGGVTLVPFHWAIVPTLRLEGGRYFRSNVNSKVRSFADDVPTYLQPALDGFGYDYASAQLGLEFGSQRGFVFFVRGGLAWVRADFGDGRGLREEGSTDGTELDVSGLSVRASGPTASLGFLFYIW
jgi:hypothetical protein